MIIELSNNLTFYLDSRRPNHLDYDIHTLIISEDGGYIEILLTDEELEDLRSVIK